MTSYKKNWLTVLLILTVGPLAGKALFASDFPALDEALPTAIDAAALAPVFDFDGDSCLPAAGISRNGEKNGGLKTSGSVTGACRSGNFMDLSNTVHRYACREIGGAEYCVHFYALYFEKDQLFSGSGGHRHDWEYAAVWTTNGQMTHGSYSAHGDLTTAPVSELGFENGHMKIVYHKEGAGSHAFRFSDWSESAENPYGEFVTPPIVTWYEFTGDGWNNMVMRNLLDSYDYGSANLPVSDYGNRFLNSANEFRPSGYPAFTQADAQAANPGITEEWVQFINDASGLCMDIWNINMANGTNVAQWHCNGGDWQRWYHDQQTGLIHSKQDPRFCLDNGGNYGNGASIMIWWCWGGDPQRFVQGGDGSIGMALDPNQVLDGYGTNAGDNVGTWWNWGGNNQRWTLQP